MAEENAACIFNLVSKKLTKVLHIHLALVYVNDRNRAVYLSVFKLCLKNCLGNVGKLSYAGRLDENTVRLIVAYNLL